MAQNQSNATEQEQKEQEQREKEQREKDKPKHSKEEAQEEQLPPVTLTSLVGKYLPKVMNDRNNMVLLEHALDDYIASIPREARTAEKKKDLLYKMSNASKALESLNIRLTQSY